MAAAGKIAKKTTKDPTGEFFDELAKRGHEPLLESGSGTLRFDLADGKRLEHWFVTINKGDVVVSHKEAKADAIVRIDKVLFDGMATGRVNATAAALRGVLVPEGDLGLLLSFQRLFASPPRSRAKTPAAGRQRSPR